MANVSSFSGAMPVIPGGTVELARVDGGYVTTNTTSESTGMNMGCSASIVCDGGPILVEAWSNYVNAGSGGTLFANVYVDGVTTANSSRVWRKATTDFGSIYGQLVITPAAGTRTIAVRPYHVTAAGYVDWATMRISKIVNQNDGLKPFWTPPVVTQLPSQATVGDQVIYAADATNGVYWQLQYDGLGTYPWKFIGGAALTAEVDTDESIAAATTTYTALATAGPSITAPLAGDYIIEQGARYYPGSVIQQGYMSFDIGATGAVDNDGIFFEAAAATYGTTASRMRKKTGLSASTALVSKYRHTSASSTVNFARRWMRVTPIRVSA